MQMFGIGLPELMVILILAVVVVGPDRLPAVAADLARWIRRTRAYAQHLMGDFNEVIGEMEKEAGASREDWKEIASLVTRHTGDIGKELEKVGGQLERSTSMDLDEAKAESGDGWTNVVPFEGAKAEKGNGVEEPHEAEQEAASSEEQQPWYVPERTSRRRSRE
jgi:Tat protein translocase TatB subunit